MISFSKILIFKFYLLLTLTCVTAQPQKEWLSRYNGPGNSFDIVSKINTGNTGNVYVYGSENGIGSLYDFVIIKYNSTGVIKWIQRFNGPGNSIDQISSAVLDESENSYVTGQTTDSLNTLNITTAKYDSSGNLLWMKFFKRAEYTSGFGHAIDIDNVGNIITAGFVRNNAGTFDIVIVKYSNSGNEISSVIYNGLGNGDDYPVSIKADSENNIVLSGTTKSISGGSNILIKKYSSSLLTPLWEEQYNGSENSDDKAAAMILDSLDNIYFCGSMINTGSSSDYYYTKLNSAGIYQWGGIHNGTGNSIDIPSSLDLDNVGNLLITGFSRNSTVIGSEDILTLKINETGNLLWARRFNGSGNGTDQGNDIETDKSGNVYIGGASDRGNVQLTYSLIKYNHEGIFQWFTGYSLNKIPEDFIYDITVDDDNNIFVTGVSIDTVNDYDIVTIKYS